jgi:uncharacterized membrane protein
MRKTLVIPAALALMLGACAQDGSMTDGGRAATIGATAGALGGLAIGSMTGSNVWGAVIGAGVGAAGGYLWNDHQQSQRRRGS